MPKSNRNNRSPRFGLIRGNRGWYKHVPGVGTKYVCSLNAAPTGENADDEYLARFPGLAQVRTVSVDSLTTKDVLDLWIENRVAKGLKPPTIAYYRLTADAFAAAAGADTQAHNLNESHAARFRESIAHLGTTSRVNRLVYIQSAFNWAIGKRFLAAKFWGDEFDRPTLKERRDDKAERVATRGLLMYEPAEVLTLINGAPSEPLPVQLWVLLGINAALGQSDLDSMTRHHVRGDRLEFPRPKSGVTRTAPLWPETAALLNAWIKAMPKDRDKLFVSATGGPLLGVHHRHLVTKAFQQLCIHTKTPARGFYSLRRTFRTMTDPLPDRHAVDLVMGHEPNDTGRRYVQSVDHARLRAVVDFVHDAIYAVRT